MRIKEISASRKPFFLLKTKEVCTRGKVYKSHGIHWFDGIFVSSPNENVDKTPGMAGSVRCADVICALSKKEFAFLIKLGLLA